MSEMQFVSLFRYKGRAIDIPSPEIYGTLILLLESAFRYSRRLRNINFTSRNGEDQLENFSIAVNAVMPLLLYMLIGQGLLRSKLLDGTTYQKLNNAIFRFFLPINLLVNVYEADVRSTFRVDVLLFAVGLTLSIFCLFAVLIPRIEKDNTKRGVMLQGTFRSNFVLFGLPIATSLLSESQLGMTSILIAVIVPLNNVLSVVALSIYSDHKIQPAQIILDILKNPMFIGTLAGILISLTGIRFPVFLDDTLSGIKGLVTPLALIVMGGTFRFDALNNARIQLAMTVFFKLVLIPIIGLTLAVLYGLTRENLVPMLTMLGGPTAVSSYTMAQQMGGDPDLASQIVVFTTILSMFSLVVFITVLKSLFLI